MVGLGVLAVGGAGLDFADNFPFFPFSPFLAPEIQEQRILGCMLFTFISNEFLFSLEM